MTVLLAIGWDPATVAKRVGHRDLSTMYRHYQHLFDTPEGKRERFDRLDRSTAPPHRRCRWSDDDRPATARNVAEIMGISPETVLRWTRRGELPGFRRPGGAIRFGAEDLDAWLDRRRVTRADTLAQPQESLTRAEDRGRPRQARLVTTRIWLPRAKSRQIAADRRDRTSWCPRFESGSRH
jgi:excisionase family DNA binding protein